MNSRGGVALAVLAGIVALEAILMAGVSALLVYELITDVPLSLASAVALLVMALLATAWLVALTISILRAAPWVRPGVIVWQVLQIAVAVGMFQGDTARPDVGWALLVPAVVAIGLVVSRPVVAATRRADVDSDTPDGAVDDSRNGERPEP